MQAEQEIRKEVVNIFKEQFAESNEHASSEALGVIPKLLNDDDREQMERWPEEDEIKAVVFDLNKDSASGPDGYSGEFYQSCWNIIKEEVVNVVSFFFCVAELPRYITHTTLVLIPKKEVVWSFNDLRPISLSSFINKIISKVIQGRIQKVLHKIISPNQTGFMKGRNISENTLLAQEIIRDINKRNKHHNVVVKLDMAKAYDRVSWIYLINIMRRFGFRERLIDQIWRLLSYNWYSILISGQIYCFFQSSRGVKQGDPLSPILFIISAEVLSKSLNALNNKEDFIGFGVKINHLSYTDDTILFCSADRQSVKMMINVVKEYEKVSGQMVNLTKSFMYLHEKTPIFVGRRLRKLTGIGLGLFPFTYLGCPIFYGRKKKEHFEGLMKKISGRILSWKSRLLTASGKYTLIGHVLQSLPIYLFSVMNPPKGIIDQIYRLIAKFFWGNEGETKGKHWVA